jgi:hypothetical protein
MRAGRASVGVRSWVTSFFLQFSIHVRLIAAFGLEFGHEDLRHRRRAATVLGDDVDERRLDVLCRKVRSAGA